MAGSEEVVAAEAKESLSKEPSPEKEHEHKEPSPEPEKAEQEAAKPESGQSTPRAQSKEATPVAEETPAAAPEAANDKPEDIASDKSHEESPEPAKRALVSIDFETKRIKVDSSDATASVANFQRRIAGITLYRPQELLFENFEDNLNSVVWVRIARRYLTRTNPSVAERRLWGSDVYTDDSDVVAMLFHCGYLDPDSKDPQIREFATGTEDLLVHVLVLPTLQKYRGCYTHDINSRSWLTPHDGGSIKIFGVATMPRGSAEFPASEVVTRTIDIWGKAYASRHTVRHTIDLLI